MSKSVRIITAHDGMRYYTDMAATAVVLAMRLGYTLEVKKTTNVKHSKASILKGALTSEWVVWMDSDSMLLGNIDHLFEVDCDLILPVKEPKNRSNRYGSYLYSGFVCVHNTSAGREFLSRWEESPTDQPSDQLNLNRVLDEYLDSSVYNQIGTVQTYGDLKVYLLDPNLYCHQQSIRDMVVPAVGVNVLHFKGRLHRQWPGYKKRFLLEDNLNNRRV